MATVFSGPVTAKAVPAGQTEANCLAPQPVGNLRSVINLYGEDNLKGANNNDWNNGLFICDPGGGNGNFPVLDNITQDANDDCKGFLGIDNNDFGDCVSSLRVDVQWEIVCVYTNTNYGGNKRKYQSDTIDNSLDFTFDDAIDSVKFIPNLANC
jgi:hypothetical protein